MSTQKQTVTDSGNARSVRKHDAEIRYLLFGIDREQKIVNLLAQRDELLAAAKFVEVELSANEGRRGRWLADVLDKAIARAEGRAE